MLVSAMVAQPSHTVQVNVDNKAHLQKDSRPALVRKAEENTEALVQEKKADPLEEARRLPKDSDRSGTVSSSSFPVSLLDEEDEDLALDELEAMTISYALMSKTPVNCVWGPWDPEDEDDLECKRGDCGDDKDSMCADICGKKTAKSERIRKVKTGSAHGGSACNDAEMRPFGRSGEVGAPELVKADCGRKACATTTTTTTTTTSTTTTTAMIIEAGASTMTMFVALALPIMVWLSTN